jgi:hypothetical protein
MNAAPLVLYTEHVIMSTLILPEKILAIVHNYPMSPERPTQGRPLL